MSTYTMHHAHHRHYTKYNQHEFYIISVLNSLIQMPHITEAAKEGISWNATERWVETATT